MSSHGVSLTYLPTIPNSPTTPNNNNLIPFYRPRPPAPNQPAQCDLACSHFIHQTFPPCRCVHHRLKTVLPPPNADLSPKPSPGVTLFLENWSQVSKKNTGGLNHLVMARSNYELIFWMTKHLSGINTFWAPLPGICFFAFFFLSASVARVSGECLECGRRGKIEEGEDSKEMC